MKEKRIFHRIPKEVEVELSELSYPLNNGSERSGRGMNIGGGGICITSSDEYSTGVLLNLKIGLSGLNNYKKISMFYDTSAEEPMTAIGEVVWCKKVPDNDYYEIGIRFVDIYEDDREALKRYLEYQTEQL